MCSAGIKCADEHPTGFYVQNLRCMGPGGSGPFPTPALHGSRRVRTLPYPCVAWVPGDSDPSLPLRCMGPGGSGPCPTPALQALHINRRRPTNKCAGSQINVHPSKKTDHLRSLAVASRRRRRRCSFRRRVFGVNRPDAKRLLCVRRTPVERALSIDPNHVVVSRA